MAETPSPSITLWPAGWQAWLRLGLGTGLSLILIIWLMITLDLRQVLLVLQTINYFWVGMGLLTVLLTIWARGRRWQVLLASELLSFSDILQALVLGQLFNLILPIRLGDIGRAHFITRRGYAGQIQALGTIALEKLGDSLMLLGLIMILSLWLPLPSWAIASTKGRIGSVLALLGGISIFLICYRRLKSKLEQGSATGLARWPQISQTLKKLEQGLAGLSHSRIMGRACSWSLIVWVLGGLTNLALLRAFGLPSSLPLAFLLLAGLMVGVALPSGPGQVGIFEGVCLAVLTLFGVEAHVALAYGVALHAVVLLPPAVLGIGFLLGLDIQFYPVPWSQ